MADQSHETLRRAAFVRLVEERTDGNSLEWEETASDNVFQAPIGKLTLRIGEYYDDETGEDYYKLELLNSDGRLVESLYPYSLMMALPDAASSFSRIFAGAMRKARKVEETLGLAIDGLKALEESDEIPF